MPLPTHVHTSHCVYTVRCAQTGSHVIVQFHCFGRHAQDLSRQRPLQEQSRAQSAGSSVQRAAGLRTPQQGCGILPGEDSSALLLDIMLNVTLKNPILSFLFMWVEMSFVACDSLCKGCSLLFSSWTITVVLMKSQLLAELRANKFILQNITVRSLAMSIDTYLRKSHLQLRIWKSGGCVHRMHKVHKTFAFSVFFQGMNFIAGYLIIITKDEEKSFWLMDALLGRMLPGLVCFTYVCVLEATPCLCFHCAAWWPVSEVKLNMSPPGLSVHEVTKVNNTRCELFHPGSCYTANTLCVYVCKNWSKSKFYLWSSCYAMCFALSMSLQTTNRRKY